jgi:proteasome assembly chaperone (PAC2) family protein
VTDPVVLHEALPTLESPVFVGMLTGWIDASGAAAAAIETIATACNARLLATFDADLFIDYRARRPTMELRDGVHERLVWPEIRLSVGRDPLGHDVLILTGPEPDAAWQRFTELVTSLATDLGTRLAVFLGAYPFASPHTRPSRLSSTSPSAALVARLPFLRSSVDVPAGVSAALEHGFHAKGVDALGIWAQVPHYLGTMTYPAASVALLDGLAEIGGLAIDAQALRNEAALQRSRVDQLVAGNEEHQAMVRQLEAVYDATEAEIFGPSATASDTLPSGDELAAEVERFLREQGDEP